MGQFLQSPDPAIKLARQYGIRGIFSPDLIPSLQPTVLIDDLTGGIENNPRRIGVVDILQGGVAAEITVIRFEVPNNVIARIFGIRLLAETAMSASIHFGSSVAAPADFVAGAYTDGRLRGNGEVPAARIGRDTYAVAPTPKEFSLPAAASPSLSPLMEVDWVIGRTDAFDFVEIWDPTVDKNLGVSMIWEEFTADQVR